MLGGGKYMSFEKDCGDLLSQTISSSALRNGFDAECPSNFGMKLFK